MATANQVAAQVARRVRDADFSELQQSEYLEFVNMALDDLSAAGWLLPLAEDVSLTLAASTYEYAVPAGFAYIKRVEQASADGFYDVIDIVPDWYWYVSNDANLVIRPTYHGELVDGRVLKIVGQKRPNTGVAGSDTIQGGMEAFVRERATKYAADYLAAGDSRLDGYRQRLAENLWAVSEKMLGSHPMEFRVKPSSVHVPGR